MLLELLSFGKISLILVDFIMENRSEVSNFLGEFSRFNKLTFIQG